eukprot:813431-Prorocentrum_minimum.AAC.1
MSKCEPEMSKCEAAGAVVELGRGGGGGGRGPLAGDAASGEWDAASSAAVTVTVRPRAPYRVLR